MIQRLLLPPRYSAYLFISVLLHLSLFVGWFSATEPRASEFTNDFAASTVIQILEQQRSAQTVRKPSLGPLPAPHPAVAQAAATGSTTEALELASGGELTVLPKVIQDHKVPYTLSAQRAGVEGVVDLDLVIAATGQVIEVQIKRGPGYGLDEAAQAAVKEFLFSPGQIGDKKVATRISYKVFFNRGGSL